MADVLVGTLSGGSIPTPTCVQDWTFDKQGNWPELNDNGTADVRQRNVVNEITILSSGYG